MKIKDLIKELERYNQDVDIYFKLMPNNKGLREESDSLDVDIEWQGEICTSGLDADEPYLEVGFIKSFHISMTTKEARDEFVGLRRDDEDFASQYSSDDFDDWLSDNEIELND